MALVMAKPVVVTRSICCRPGVTSRARSTKPCVLSCSHGRSSVLRMGTIGRISVRSSRRIWWRCDRGLVGWKNLRFDVERPRSNPKWVEEKLALALYLREGIAQQDAPVGRGTLERLNSLAIHAEGSVSNFRNPTGVATKLANLLGSIPTTKAAWNAAVPSAARCGADLRPRRTRLLRMPSRLGKRAGYQRSQPTRSQARRSRGGGRSSTRRAVPGLRSGPRPYGHPT